MEAKGLINLPAGNSGGKTTRGANYKFLIAPPTVQFILIDNPLGNNNNSNNNDNNKTLEFIIFIIFLSIYLFIFFFLNNKNLIETLGEFHCVRGPFPTVDLAID